MPYAYQADLYCDACGLAIIAELNAAGVEDAGDTDGYPQWAPDDAEADCPQHCGALSDCLEAIEVDGHKIGAWLGNPLTSEGVRYVREAVLAGDGLCCDLWREYYPEVDYGDDGE